MLQRARRRLLGVALLRVSARKSTTRSLLDCRYHTGGCERDFEAADTYEEKDCDTAAGCVYTPAPKMEKVVVAHGPDQLKCDNVYMPGVLGA